MQILSLSAIWLLPPGGKLAAALQPYLAPTRDGERPEGKALSPPHCPLGGRRFPPRLHGQDGITWTPRWSRETRTLDVFFRQQSGQKGLEWAVGVSLQSLPRQPPWTKRPPSKHRGQKLQSTCGNRSSCGGRSQYAGCRNGQTSGPQTTRLTSL